MAVVLKGWQLSRDAPTFSARTEAITREESVIIDSALDPEPTALSTGTLGEAVEGGVAGGVADIDDFRRR